ncbi:MAG: hypothetical protein ACQEQF_06705 [Bacillota bacterium]
MHINKPKSRANRAYDLINETTQKNMILQGVSGFFGPMGALGTDVYVIVKIYSPMINNIRKIYGRKPLDKNILVDFVKGALKEVLNDMIFDKGLGSIPVMGVYFNAICARAMTWRIGILFTMLASRGEKAKVKQIKETMILIRKVFPNESNVKFKKPEQRIFNKIVTSVEGEDIETYDKKIDDALSAF